LTRGPAGSCRCGRLPQRYGEVDIQSAPWLRDELLRVVRRHGPRLISLVGLRDVLMAA
jgi:hypothetical protein